MKRTSRYLAALVPLLLASLAQAKDLPNVNAYYGAKPIAAPVASGAVAPAIVASTDTASGRPTMLWGVSGANAASKTLGLTPEAAARLHLLTHAGRYGLTPAALATAEVKEIHDTGRGGILVSFQQRVKGVTLFHNDVKVMMDRSLALVAIGGNLHPAAVSTPKVPAFSVSDVKAVATALSDLYGAPFQPSDLVDTKKTKAEYRYYGLAPTPLVKAQSLHFTRPSRVKKVYFPLPDRIVPAYYLELLSGDVASTDAGAFGYVIAADDGRVLYRENQTHHDSYNYRVWADPGNDHRPADGPMADFTPHPTGVPDGSYPPYVAPSLVSMDGFNKNPSGTFDPWLPKGATVTTGNNVDAYTDDDAPDGFSGADIRADATSANAFDRIFDPTLGPQSSANQKKAAVTQIFYVTNWLHDWWYDSGFNEAAGNGQQDNLGRGGIAGDPLDAEAQDGAPKSRNNANMSAGADGESPRMQMYVWDGLSASSVTVQPLNQTYTSGVASFGPQSFNLSGTVILAQDGTAPTTDACQAITNNVAGKIVLLDRGTCTFKQKVQAAQTAGAIGVILANNAPGGAPAMPANQGGPAINIPVLSITQADGATLKAALMNGPVTTTLARTASVDRDGTIDNTVVAHEWGHYIHLRLVACGSPTCSAESEGWGDFNASLMTLRQGDPLTGTYAAAQYATGSFFEPGYFGIRRYPYSTDTTKNPLTFKHIMDSEALPANIPVADTGANNAEAHNAGEVWSIMLFEAYMSLLAKTVGPAPTYSYGEAHRRMSDYVVAGMKLAPTDPTFTEQRDAILAAAAAADANDFDAMAKAFAKRGAGSCAVSPPRDSTDFAGVVESFTVNPNVQALSVKVDDSVFSCDKDGFLDAGEAGKITVDIVNAGPAATSETVVTVATTTSGVTFPNGPTIKLPPLAAYAKTTAQIDVKLDASIAVKSNLDIAVTVQNPDACTATATITTAPFINVDKLTASAAFDDVEPETTAWKVNGTDSDKIWSRIEPTAGNHVWRGIDYGSPTDTALESPILLVSPTDDFSVTFDHRHQFESSMGTNWDGGVIEISTDNGGSWQDITKFGDPGYGGTIGDPQGQAQNVLKDRDGFVDQNTSWPAMDTVTVAMGKTLAGMKVRLRFRIGSDDAAGNYGWEVDNVAFKGITNTPFDSLVVDAAPCGEMSSVASGDVASAGTGDPVNTTSASSMGVGGASTGGTGGDGGGSSNKDDLAFGGCGCFVGGSSSSPLFATPLFLLSALLLRRRSQRRR
jgi:fungalysin metallopeptidase (M36)/PA domain-containing protein